jgi:hypothetical protein
LRIRKNKGNVKMNPQVYRGLQNLSAEISSRILTRLNALDSAEEIVSVLAVYAGQNVLSARTAQKLFRVKEGLGTFQDLRQIAAVPGIGTKRLTTIINALGRAD